MVRLGVHRRDRRLHGEAAGVLTTSRLLRERQPLDDPAPVPSAAILVLERDRHSVGVFARSRAGLGQQQQRQQPLRFGGRRHQAVHDTGQADRLPGQLPPDRGIARARGVPLGEHQRDRREHQRQAAFTLVRVLGDGQADPVGP